MNYLQKEQAVFAFNIWDINSAKAVLDAAAKAQQNVILQVSASNYGNVRRIPLKDFVHRYAEENDIKAWLHLDHCKDLQIIEDAIKHQWDSVMMDASHYEIGKNIEFTNRVTAIAHKNNVAVEAEVGQLKGVEDDVASTNHEIADREEIRKFIRNTDIDMIAVAFGNAHGIYKGQPQLDYELVEFTTSISEIPFVVHGGSGLSDNTLKRLINIRGVRKINISTDVKLAYREGIVNAQKAGLLQEDGFQAVKVEQHIHDAIARMAAEKLKLL